MTDIFAIISSITSSISIFNAVVGVRGLYLLTPYWLLHHDIALKFYRGKTNVTYNSNFPIESIPRFCSSVLERCSGEFPRYLSLSRLTCYSYISNYHIMNHIRYKRDNNLTISYVFDGIKILFILWYFLIS